MKYHYASEKGFTLIEIMISMLILILVITGAYQLSLASNTLLQTQKMEIELRNEGNIALEKIANDLQQAQSVTLTQNPTPNPDGSKGQILQYTDSKGVSQGPYYFSTPNPGEKTSNYIKSLGITDSSNLFLTGISLNNDSYSKNLLIRLTLSRDNLSVDMDKYIFIPNGNLPMLPFLLSITPHCQNNGTPPQQITIISQNTNFSSITSIQIGNLSVSPSSLTATDNNNQQSITINDTEILKQLSTGSYDLKVQGLDKNYGNIVLTMPNAYTVVTGGSSATPFLVSVLPDYQYANTIPLTLTITSQNTNFKLSNTTIQLSNQTCNVTLKPDSINNTGNNQQVITVTNTTGLGQLAEGEYDLTVNNLNMPNAYRVLPATQESELLSISPNSQYYGIPPQSLTIASQYTYFDNSSISNISIQIGNVTLSPDSVSNANNHQQNITVSNLSNNTGLSQLPVGTYDLIVSQGNTSLTLHNAYTILQAQPPVLLSINPTSQYSGAPPQCLTVISQYTNFNTVDTSSTIIQIGDITLTPSSISSPDNNYRQSIVVNYPNALGQLSTGTYDVKVLSNNTPTLTSPGAYTVQPASTPIFDMAIFTTGTSTYIKAPVTGNVGSNNNVNLDWGGYVTGNIYVPNGCNVIVPDWSNLISGSIQVLDKPRQYLVPQFPAFPALTAPSNDLPVVNNGSLALPQQGSQSNNWQYIDQYTISQDGQYSNITINNNATLYINVGTGTRTIRVANLDVEQGSIVLVGTGTLNLYVDNNLYIKGYFNGTNNTSGNPSQAMIYYGGTNKLTFSNETQLYGNLWIKTADLSLTGSGAVKGNIISGGNNVELEGGGSTVVQALYAPNAYVYLHNGSDNTFVGSIIAKTFYSVGGAAVTFAKSSTPFPIPIANLTN